jgi:hypothetical protein
MLVADSKQDAVLESIRGSEVNRARFRMTA